MSTMGPKPLSLAPLPWALPLNRTASDPQAGVQWEEDLTTGNCFPYPPSYMESGRCGASGQESPGHLLRALPARTPPPPPRTGALLPPRGTVLLAFLPGGLALRMRPSPNTGC